VRFLLPFLLFTSAFCLDSPDEIKADGYLLGTSVHLRGTKHADGFNAANYGLGLGSTAWWHRDGYSVGLTGLILSYEDSYYQHALGGGIGPAILFGATNSAHITAALPIGYLDGSGYCGPMAMPLVAVGYGPIDVCATIAPPLGWATDDDTDKYTAIGIFLRFSIDLTQ